MLNQAGGSGLPPAPFSSQLAWADTRAPFPTRSHHQHSHSGSSIHSVIPISDPPALGYSQIGNGFASTFSSHPPPVMPVSMVPVPSPPRPAHLVRPSRPSSLSNAYLPSAYEVHPKTSPGPSRSQTPIASSPSESSYSSFGEDYNQSPPPRMYGEKKRARPDDGGPMESPRPKKVRRRSTTDANGIPSEYKAEVDRIFFDFLDIICSNCGCFPRNTTRVLTNDKLPLFTFPFTGPV